MHGAWRRNLGSAGTWSLDENDHRRITDCLTELLKESQARCALVVDRAGQLLANAGEELVFDATAFASLTAADFSANDQLAKMIGEPEFGSLFPGNVAQPPWLT